MQLNSTESSPYTHSYSGTVLVVDDEESIRRTLGEALEDEGFSVVLASGGLDALKILGQQTIDLVLLDIWMPGMDGIEALTSIKALKKDLPVIMMSGHATIGTAMTSTRLGAADFIEKPFDLPTTLNAIKRALVKPIETRELPEDLKILGEKSDARITPVVFNEQKLKGRAYPQRTLAHSALLYGQGLHSGQKSGLVLEPLPVNSGLHFVGVSGQFAVPAHIDFVESTGFATTLKRGDTQVSTIEHLMSALNAYGITNLLIKCNGEVPVMDGSAMEFCKLFEDVGVTDQEAECYEIALDRVIEIGDPAKEYIKAEPADEFVIDYTLKYPEPVGEQHFIFTLSDIENYKKEIATCRTFGFVKDIGHLQKKGLALGGRFDNFVLIGPSGTVNGAWRFSDEPVRHKILDCIGDLYLLGRRLRAKITAKMTGHSDNVELLKEIGKLLIGV